MSGEFKESDFRSVELQEDTEASLDQENSPKRPETASELREIVSTHAGRVARFVSDRQALNSRRAELVKGSAAALGATEEEQSEADHLFVESDLARVQRGLEGLERLKSVLPEGTDSGEIDVMIGALRQKAAGNSGESSRAESAPENEKNGQISAEIQEGEAVSKSEASQVTAGGESGSEKDREAENNPDLEKIDGKLAELESRLQASTKELESYYKMDDGAFMSALSYHIPHRQIARDTIQAQIDELNYQKQLVSENPQTPDARRAILEDHIKGQIARGPVTSVWTERKRFQTGETEPVVESEQEISLPTQIQGDPDYKRLFDQANFAPSPQAEMERVRSKYDPEKEAMKMFRAQYPEKYEYYGGRGDAGVENDQVEIKPKLRTPLQSTPSVPSNDIDIRFDEDKSVDKIEMTDSGNQDIKIISSTDTDPDTGLRVTDDEAKTIQLDDEDDDIDINLSPSRNISQMEQSGITIFSKKDRDPETGEVAFDLTEDHMDLDEDANGSDSLPSPSNFSRDDGEIVWDDMGFDSSLDESEVSITMGPLIERTRMLSHDQVYDRIQQMIQLIEHYRRQFPGMSPESSDMSRQQQRERRQDLRSLMCSEELALLPQLFKGSNYHSERPLGQHQRQERGFSCTLASTLNAMEALGVRNDLTEQQLGQIIGADGSTETIGVNRTLNFLRQQGLAVDQVGSISQMIQELNDGKVITMTVPGDINHRIVISAVNINEEGNITFLWNDPLQDAACWTSAKAVAERMTYDPDIPFMCEAIGRMA